MDFLLFNHSAPFALRPPVLSINLCSSTHESICLHLFAIC